MSFHFQVVAALEVVRKSDACFMLGITCDMEVDQVITYVRSIGSGVGVQGADVPLMTDFHKLCLTRIAHFQRCDVPKGSAFFVKGCAASATSKTLTGEAAIQFKFGALQRSIKDGKEITAAELRVFRTYDWLLTEEQRDLRESWMERALQAVGLAPAKMILDDVDDKKNVASSCSAIEGDAVAVGETVKKASNVSKDLTLVKACKPKASPSVSQLQKKLSSESVDEGHAGLMKFFVAKKS